MRPSPIIWNTLTISQVGNLDAFAATWEALYAADGNL